MTRTLTGLVLCLVLAGATRVGLASGTPIKVFIFSGQSNMTGEYGLDELDFMGYDLSLPQNDITSDYWLSGNTQNDWLPLHPHTEVTNTSYGSELSFMRIVKDADSGTEYASLKLSRGGANLYGRWAPHNNDIYQLARDYGLAALQRLTNLGYDPEVVGLIWIHGDGDLYEDYMCEAYAENLDELVTAFRTDFNAPGMMAIVSQTHINQQNGNPNVLIQRQEKIDFVTADSNAVLIDIDDLTYRDFFIHLDGTSRLVLGQRMADAYLATLAPPCAPDINGDSVLDNGDLMQFVTLFLAGDPAIDLNGDGIIDNGDIINFINLYLAGCP